MADQQYLPISGRAPRHPELPFPIPPLPEKVGLVKWVGGATREILDNITTFWFIPIGLAVLLGAGRRVMPLSALSFTAATMTGIFLSSGYKGNIHKIADPNKNTKDVASTAGVVVGLALLILAGTPFAKQLIHLPERITRHMSQINMAIGILTASSMGLLTGRKLVHRALGSLEPLPLPPVRQEPRNPSDELSNDGVDSFGNHGGGLNTNRIDSTHYIFSSNESKPEYVPTVIELGDREDLLPAIIRELETLVQAEENYADIPEETWKRTLDQAAAQIQKQNEINSDADHLRDRSRGMLVNLAGALSTLSRSHTIGDRETALLFEILDQCERITSWVISKKIVKDNGELLEDRQAIANRLIEVAEQLLLRSCEGRVTGNAGAIGNCFYDSMRILAEKEECDSLIEREMVCNHLRDNPAWYFRILRDSYNKLYKEPPGGVDKQACYIAHAREPGSEAGLPEVYAAATLLKQPIIIVQKNEAGLVFIPAIVMPQAELDENKAPLYLFFKHGTSPHYEPLLKPEVINIGPEGIDEVIDETHILVNRSELRKNFTDLYDEFVQAKKAIMAKQDLEIDGPDVEGPPPTMAEALQYIENFSKSCHGDNELADANIYIMFSRIAIMLIDTKEFDRTGYQVLLSLSRLPLKSFHPRFERLKNSSGLLPLSWSLLLLGSQADNCLNRDGSQGDFYQILVEEGINRNAIADELEAGKDDLNKNYFDAASDEDDKTTHIAQVRLSSEASIFALRAAAELLGRPLIVFGQLNNGRYSTRYVATPTKVTNVKPLYICLDRPADPL